MDRYSIAKELNFSTPIEGYHERAAGWLGGEWRAVWKLLEIKSGRDGRRIRQGA
jgi:hypothetical protein